ncbi:hypothetical protein HME7025_00091 [Aquirufa nivalisilvae]|uniref:Uncharacterized protein n=1 Tax=Aquirufa nivalisilvae TaxID=2516557 RepID=A0A2S2DRH0_9BACT|nr:hypothetical protein [Aquirufa nivalisilvae]AWL07976.1 hypothetical protein HME7025_00091 [Aquirufa nivalisilvae]
MKIFAHQKQIKFLKSRARLKRFIGGRGSAKTHTLGFSAGMAHLEMPRAKFALTGLTYVQIDLVVLPVIREALEYMGIFELSKSQPFGHYVIGVKPPDHWEKPYKKVGRLGYQYCMSFINGFTIQFVSQDRPETHRGLNIDGQFDDEQATMSEDFIYKIIAKAIRGNEHKRFSNSRFFHCHYGFSSAAWYQEGMHIYKLEDAWKEQNIKRGEMSYEELKKTKPELLYVEATCLDNPLTGQKYWDEQKLSDDPLIFDVEVANMRLSTLPNGFYYAFKTSKHVYWEKQSYQFDDKIGLHIHRSNDYLEDKPLAVTLDFNADICWLVVLQEVSSEERIIRSNFIKPNTANSGKDIVIQQAEWFCETYSNHACKDIFVYGDPNGNRRSELTSDNNRPSFDRFCQVLKKNGWDVFRKELTSYPKHKKKYALMNSLLSEDDSNLPKIRINQHTNKVLIITLQATPIDGETYTKVKKQEKLQPLARREYAPDGTDALDYYFYAKYGHRVGSSGQMKNQLYIYRG